MAWEIIQQRVLPRNPSQGPEDAICESEWCIAVIDGHSNCCPNPIDSRTSGQYLVQAGCVALNEMSPDTRPDEVVPALSRAIEPIGRRFAPDSRERPGFVFEMLLTKYDTIVRVGDCQYLIDGRGINHGMEAERLNARLRCLKLRRLLAEGFSRESLCSEDPTRPFIKKRIAQWQKRFRNADDPRFGFGVINGAEVPERFREIIPLTGSEKSIIFSSDGYPEWVLADSLEETEERLQELLRNDPLCIERWPSVRGLAPGADRTDDCTYVRMARR